MNVTRNGLLGADEPPAVTVTNNNGSSPFVIVADHAGKQMPRRLEQLGLSDTDRDRHIAWDIGIARVCSLMGQALDAVVIQQTYSRLVIDCNRTPGTETSILEMSEATPVPGNIGLTEVDRRERVQEIFKPYHDCITRELDRRRDLHRPTTLISMHSFTPVFKSVVRPWHVGMLYQRDRRFADILMALLGHEQGLVIGDNEPYSVTDESDYTIPVHGEQRSLNHVAIEIRQDLIAEDKGQRTWAALFARLLPLADAQLRIQHLASADPC